MLLFTAGLLCAESRAQNGQSPVFVYGDVIAGGGYCGSFQAMANVLFLKHHEISAGYNAFWRRSPQVPADYQYSTFLNFSPFHYPQTFLSGASFGYGYVVYPHKLADRIRYIARAGILLDSRSEAVNFQGVSTFFGPNYNYSRITASYTGIILQPTLAYTPSKGFGLTVSLFGIYSNRFSGGGITAGLLFGKVDSYAYRVHHPRRKRHR